MKKLLILLSLCVFVIACDDMQKPVMDVIDDATAPSEEPFGDVPRITVPDAILEGKITGPWIWMIAPTEPGRGGPGSIDIDSLGIASNGVVTEIDVSTNGVVVGDMVGGLDVDAWNDFWSSRSSFSRITLMIPSIKLVWRKVT